MSRSAIALLVLALSTGCVEHKLFVKTDPLEADVEVDGVEIGRGTAQQPVFVTFEHYGIRRVVARAPERQTKETTVTLDPPWWQITPMDFITDVLVPWKIEDESTVEIALEKRAPSTREGAEAAEKRARAVEAAESPEKKP